MQGLLVQKFGGTAVGDVGRIQAVADRVMAAYQAGHSIVVVLSAMAGETDRLERLAHSAVGSAVDPREMDVLLATGEQVTVALLAMILRARGLLAKSYLGFQVCIYTDNVHNQARIVSIDTEKIKLDLREGTIVVVAGFQGVDKIGNITTLGRGGSDTTAVGLAVALGAEECQIFTDVDGIYTADPRIVANARRMPKIVFEEMLELASLGAKVLQVRSVELAGKSQLPLRVLSAFHEGTGTLVTFEQHHHKGCQPVTGIASHRHEAQIQIRQIPTSFNVAADILQVMSSENIDVDMIAQHVNDEDTTDFSFTVHRRDYTRAKRAAERMAVHLQAKSVSGREHLAKISLVGLGIRSQIGVAHKMFEVLRQAGIQISAIATSEIKVSILTDEKYLELGVQALHEAFALHTPPVEEGE